MLRHVAPVLLIAGILAVGADMFFMRYIIRETQSRGQYKVYRSLYENDPNEIPIFGSSRAVGNYIPSLIHPDCFDYGIEKSQGLLALVFLTHELKKPRKTPIILNFDYQFFQNWGPNEIQFLPYLSDSLFGAYYRDKYDYSFTKRIPGIRFFGKYTEYMSDYLVDKNYEAGGSISKQFYLEKGCYIGKKVHTEKSFAFFLEQRKHKTEFWAYEPKLADAFYAIMKRFPERHIFLVVSPYHPAFLDSFVGENLAKQYLRRLAELPNVHVLNYARMELELSDYTNTSHLNYNGAQKFSKELRRALNQYPEFPSAP